MSILDDMPSRVGDRAAIQVVAERVRARPDLLADVAEGLTERDQKLVGDCAEVFTMVAEHEPQVVADYLPQLVPHLRSKNGRVRWESMHVVALTARYAGRQMAKLVPDLVDIMSNDESVIVCRYATQALGEYATTGPKAAQTVFPHLMNALTMWEGRHAAVALEALEKVASRVPSLAENVIEVAKQHSDSDKAAVRRVAKATIKHLSPSGREDSR